MKVKQGMEGKINKLPNTKKNIYYNLIKFNFYGTIPMIELMVLSPLSKRNNINKKKEIKI